MSDEESLVFRLRKRAEIRRGITTRRSVQEGKPDRIAELLEEAAGEISLLLSEKDELRRAIIDWQGKQGHDACWYYPDIFRRVAIALGVPAENVFLPPRAEFVIGCCRYQDELYGEKK